jgi:hypothetical protein
MSSVKPLENILAAAAEPFLFDEEIPTEPAEPITFDLLQLDDGQKTPTDGGYAGGYTAGYTTTNTQNSTTGQDWMMSFESPQKLQPSLLDCDIQTPTSVLKYSSKDLEIARKEMGDAHALEIGLAKV